MEVQMQKHAEAILKLAASWGWGPTQQSGRFEVITHELWLALITESQKLGGTILAQFWLQMGSCHPRLKENSKSCSRYPLSVDDICFFHSCNPEVPVVYI